MYLLFCAHFMNNLPLLALLNLDIFSVQNALMVSGLCIKSVTPTTSISFYTNLANIYISSEFLGRCACVGGSPLIDMSIYNQYFGDTGPEQGFVLLLCVWSLFYNHLCII